MTLLGVMLRRVQLPPVTMCHTASELHKQGAPGSSLEASNGEH